LGYKKAAGLQALQTKAHNKQVIDEKTNYRLHSMTLNVSNSPIPLWGGGRGTEPVLLLVFFLRIW
jgi:hypothetical protein